VAGRLKKWLVAAASPWRSGSVFALQLLALAAFLVAMARPTWGEQRLEIPERGKNLMLVVDVSRSMLADDVKPDRLGRTKLAAEDIVRALPEYRVGLVAFAGRAYLQAPLTSDHDAVVETIQNLDGQIIPRGGSMLSEGIRESLEAFKKTKARSHGLLLFSDGGDDDPKLEAQLAEAVEAGVTILAVGVGTAVGSLIPNPERDTGGSDYVVDPATGTAVHTRLDDRLLRQAAERTGGMYLPLGPHSLTGSVVSGVMRSIEALDAGSREKTKPIQRFYWPLSVGIVSLMFAMLLRPVGRFPRVSPAAAAGIIVLGFGVVPSEAAVLKREPAEVKEAREAYNNQQYERARDQYARMLAEQSPPAAAEDLAYGLAASAHQLKDYDRALENYSRALQATDATLQKRAHQGLGTALYEQGVKAFTQQPEYTVKVWTDSLRHYDSALKLGTDNRVVANRAHVEEQLKRLKEQMEQQRQQQQQKGQKGDKNQQQGESGDESEGSEGDEGEPQQPGQKGKSQPGQSGDEGQQDQPEPGEGDDPQQQGEQGKGDNEEQSQEGQGEGEQQNGEGQALPEGQIEAGESETAGMTEAEREQLQQALEDQIQGLTGFSKSQARELIRAYSDQMSVQFRKRREAPVGNDW
jgi:Ca-activated chloride channel homolog